MEQALVARARAGDRQAFEALVGPLIEPGCRLAKVMLGDWGDAEDAVQDAAINAWRAIGRLNVDTVTIRPWFLTIVANCCRSRRRRRWRALRLFPEPAAGEVDPSDVVSMHADLRSAIRRLPDADRQLLVLHYYLDLPLREVAPVMRLSEAAVKSRLHRIHHRLRPRLDPSEALS